MRHRFVTDHFFAAELMGFHDFHPILHRPAVDLYFGKNPNVRIQEQHPIKNRMHLDPRFTFKTTLGRVDDVQWLAAFPEEITLLNQTATQPLAKAISKSEASYFWQQNYTQPTDIQLLFPEVVTMVEPFKGQAETWNTPTRKGGELDSSIAFTSPLSVQSGWHPIVLNSDDMAETNNSGIHASPERRKGVIDTYHTNKNALTPGGYNNVRGTRYHPFEMYGDILEKMDPDMWKLLIRSSITVKSGQRLVPGDFPAEEDLILNFPGIPGLSYRELRAKFYENYESFMCQQQNDPQGGHIATFDDKMWDTSQIDPDRILPYGGETYTCWQMPYKDLPAAGAAARIIDGRINVVECWQGNYTPSRLAEKMVTEHKRLQAEGMMILTTPGSEFMAGHIRNEAAKKNISVRIMWMDWEENEERRSNEVKQLEPMMKAGRVLFSTSMNKGQECRRQFVHFGLVEEKGIIECVSKFAAMVPLSQLRANLQEEELEWQRRRREDSLISSFLNQQGMPAVDEQAKQKAVAHMQAIERTSTFNMPPLPGGLDG